MINTLGDLRDLMEKLEGYVDDTPLVFQNRFQEFKLSKTFNYDQDEKAIMVDCIQVGSALQGMHRVLGKE